MFELFAVFARIQHPSNSPWWKNILVELAAFTVFGAGLCFLGWLHSLWKGPLKEEEKP
jgi:hypothetical protein